MKHTLIPLAIGTGYLTIYLLFILFNEFTWAKLLFGLSPLIVIWVVVSVLKNGTYPKELRFSEDNKETLYENL